MWVDLMKIKNIGTYNICVKDVETKKDVLFHVGETLDVELDKNVLETFIKEKCFEIKK